MSESPLPTLSPTTLEFIYGIAHSQIERKQYGEALPHFQLLTFYKMTEQSYWHGLGMAYQGLKKYRDALEAYTKGAALNIENPHIHLRAAECFFALNEKKKALHALMWAEKGLFDQPNDRMQAKIQLLRALWSVKNG